MSYLTLEGYQIAEQLHAGRKSSVYRGIRQENGQAVVLKVLNEEFPPSDVLRQFEFEFRVLQELQIPGVVGALSLERLEHTRVIVMADDEALSLARYLPPDEPLALPLFWGIAIQLANIAEAIHAAGIIHKDLNPTNIIIIPKTGRVKAIDFGIAALAQRETQEAIAPDRLEGTLPYLSPEQTGRMNRSIDYRSDFYALGATFYHMLTGRPPFESHDPVELVHCHIARQPISPSDLNLEVPPALSAVVMKLLAKNAEDRYQSAAGLKYDLEQCRTHPAGFTPGSRDRSERFQIPEKLYGREQEIGELLAAFERAVSGGKEMVLCSGHPGIGKSALIQEVQKPIAATRGYFIQGKFELFEKNIPYSALKDAFQELFKQILTEPEERLTDWKRRISEAVGNNGGVIIELIPELELILGPQPELQSLPPTESQNRFNMVFQEFLHAAATSEHPLVLFLDDLQWADSASLELLRAMFVNPALSHMLFLGAYRDTEVDRVHPVLLTLDKLAGEGIRWRQILLDVLQQDQLVAMLEETFSCGADKGNALAGLIARKTAGNPFFVREFLKALYERRLLTFENGWTWDVGQIEQADITENVAELMTEKMAALPERSQNLLKAAGAIGMTFELATLCHLCEKAEATVVDELRPAQDEGMIVKHGGAFRFVHDRVREAAYSSVSPAEKELWHYRLGKLLLSAPEGLPVQLFGTVNHLNSAKSLLNADERDSLCRLNLEAGRKAKASTAYDAAAGFFEHGISLLPGNAWETAYDSAFSLHLEFSETVYLAGEYEKADELFSTLLERARPGRDKARVYAVQIDYFTIQTKFEEALKRTYCGLEELGADFTKQTSGELFETALADVEQRLSALEIETLADAPELSDPTILDIQDILVRSVPVAYFTDPTLMMAFSVQIVNLSLQHGMSRFSSYGFVMYGCIVLEAVMQNVERGYQVGRLAIRLADKYDARIISGSVYYIYTLVLHLKQPLRDVLSFFLNSYKLCLDSGNYQYLAYTITVQTQLRLFSGMPLKEARAESHESLLRFRRLQQPQAEPYFFVYLQLLETLSGEVSGKGRLQGEFFDEETMLPKLQEQQDVTSLGHLHVARLFLGYLTGDYETASDAAQHEDIVAAGLIGQATLYVFHLFHALTLAALYAESSEEVREQQREKIIGIRDIFEPLVEYCPENYRHKHQLICAELARITGKPVPETSALYDRAIAGAREQDFLQEEAIANECAARYFLARGMTKVAALYLQEARYCYLTWGCAPKVAQLDERYAELLSPVSQKRQSSRVTLDEESGTTDSVFVDMATVIKASRAISGEITLERLLIRIMEIIIENAGAQHGCLILDHDGELSVDASANVETAGVNVTAAVPLAESPLVSDAIVRYVFRSGAAVMLRDATQEGDFTHDPHIQRVQAKSVLCLPVRVQDRTVGALYLENDLAAGAFTGERIELLNILLPQMAISLENARLYENISASLREKEVLLKEVHHRVKNNLQVISSLLNLQARKVQDATALNAFQESRNRLRSMTLVHEQLYRSDDLASLDFSRYVRRLTAELMRGGHPNAGKIPLKLEVGEVNLTLDQAIPCGLVLTELLSNALKHAFPEGKEGEILLEVQQDAEEGLHIVVADTGIGLPPDLKLERAPSVGLQLVFSLVTRQLKGRISAESPGGARFTIVVPGTRVAG